jgi:hypothetical protein
VGRCGKTIEHAGRNEKRKEKKKRKRASEKGSIGATAEDEDGDW